MNHVIWHNLPCLDSSSYHFLEALSEKLQIGINNQNVSILCLVGDELTLSDRFLFADKLLSDLSETIETEMPTSAFSFLASFHSDKANALVIVFSITVSPFTTKNEILMNWIHCFCMCSSLLVFWPSSSDPLIDILLRLYGPLYQMIDWERHNIATLYELLPQSIAISSESTEQMTMGENRVSALEDLVRLGHLGVYSLQSIVEVNGIERKDMLLNKLRTKSMFGTALTANLLGQLMIVMDQMIHSDVEEIDIEAAWDQVVHSRCKEIANEAFVMYSECLEAAVSESPPHELDAFQSLHEEMSNLAMEIYQNGAKYASMEPQTVQQHLRKQLHEVYQQELGKLHDHSLQYCMLLKEDLWCLLQSNFEKEGQNGSNHMVLDAVKAFLEQYQDQAKGPAKSEVLALFVQQEASDALKYLEEHVTREANEEQVKDLRALLKQEYEDKREALTVHFKIEEEKMRQSVVSERKMMEKARQAHNVRANLDDNETSRLRVELKHHQEENKKLTEQAIVLEQNIVDASMEKKVLEETIQKLRHDLEMEGEHRCELIETLSQSIKIAEDKEKNLEAQITKLRELLESITLNADTRHQSLVATLDKRNEERKELQARLNELFMKITALPPSLQHEYFCTDREGDVQFADALAGYMIS
uniref:Uncharacterized protein AlNc14C72G4939 n=1 Tax=Albugo laibachii Nc14 TaxID=890382 RepID=F0WE84_9STRA|nr:conserved hypothetical protein [Albugo laibachii Nc14]|eukprot:CCA19513.1 conserved hypothetical protein [Albugo laibachii Nc14]